MKDDFLSPKTKAGKLRRALYGLWKEHKEQGDLPTSARFLYYELIAEGVISKTMTARTDGKKGRRPDQDLIDALTSLREAGMIPWEDIVDETREFTEWRAYDSIKNGMREAWENSRLNLWGSDLSPVILCESRSLRGVLERLAMEYQTPIASTNGQTVGFLHTTVGPALAPGQSVLYLGDLDFSGGHIEANTQRVLEEIVGSSLAWERVAITSDQVKELGLEPIQKYDARDKKKHSAVETEALGQSRIVAILRGRLRNLMPTKRMKVVQAREREERIRLGEELGFI